MTHKFAAYLAICVATFLAGVAHAEDKQSARGQEQVRRLKQQVQQLQQAQQTQQQSEQKIALEKSAADEQLKRRTGELGSVKQKLTAAERQLAELDARVKAIEQERDTLTAKLADTSKKLTEVDGLQRDTLSKLRTRDGDAQGLQVSLTAELAERKRCEANNIALYQHGRELMSLYENKGVVSSLRQREPLFGLGQVRVENLLEEYRDKLDAQKRQATLADVTVSAGKP